MNKTVILTLLVVGLLFIAGCGSGATGAVPRAPPAPSGGGCGIGAPADVQAEIVAAADAVEANNAL